MKNTILIIGLVVIILGAWLLIRKPDNSVSLTPTATSTLTDINNEDIQNPNASGTDATSTAESMITINSPKANSTNGSPITLSGSARGNWFFEAVAPVRITDKSGNTLGQGLITATGEWMTTEFVPFTGSLTYTLPTGATTTEGFVVFMNDNPSGDPSRDLTVRVPVVLTK